MEKRGQAAIEYMMIVGFVLLLIIPTILLFQSNVQSTSREATASHLQRVGLRLVDAAEQVYFLGPPSKLTAKVLLPAGIENISIGPRELVFTVKQRGGFDEIVITSEVNITGNLSPAQGTKNIIVEARNGYVWLED